jgi:hypothetical protein
MEKVIFDTNRLYNKQGTTFLSKNVCNLECFQKISEIIIPDIVIGELENKYKRDFEEEKEKFVKTILNSFLSHDAEKLSPEEKITQLKKSEIIKYEVVELKDYSVLFEMKNLALKKEPPFKRNTKGDPGFKDAYIYFTILEYLQICTDKYIFVCTKDLTLKEALQKHQNIKVVEDFEEFKQESISSIYDEYFVKKLKEKINPNITEDSIVDYWVGINGNQILLIEIHDEKFVVEIEQREIISFENTNNYDVNDIINSGNYAMTHSAVAALDVYKNYFSDEEILNILEAVINNSQIIPDEDVQQFINDIFEPKKHLLEEETKNKIEYFLK